MILLTGATGFLGEYILRELLEAKYEVRTLVRNPENRQLPWRSMVDIAEGDILDILSLEKAMEGVEAVIHAAAYVSFWRKKRDLVREVNVQGTANLVNYALKQENPPKFIHVSSVAGIGRSRKGMNTEDTEWKIKDAASTYAISKKESEYEVYRGIGEGLHGIILNPGLILGPTRDWNSGTGKIFTQVDKGLPFYKKASTGIVGVKDVARACRMMLEKEIEAGKRFILVSENWSYHHLLGEIAQALGKKAPAIRIPGTLALLGGRVVEFLANFGEEEPGITFASMKSSNSEDHYDGSRIDQLGFSYTPIEEVIREAAAAFKKDNSD